MKGFITTIFKKIGMMLVGEELRELKDKISKFENLDLDGVENTIADRFIRIKGNELMKEVLETVAENTPFDEIVEDASEKLLIRHRDRLMNRVVEEAAETISNDISEEDIIEKIAEGVNTDEVVEKLAEDVDTDEIIEKVAESVLEDFELDEDAVMDKVTENVNMDDVVRDAAKLIAEKVDYQQVVVGLIAELVALANKAKE